MSKRISDPGLGEKYYQNKSRMVNKDGSFNSERTGMHVHLYHYLVTVSGFKISLIITTAYIILNLMFAAIYVMAGVEHLGGNYVGDGYLKAFLFSMQAFTTVGFGAIYPDDAISGLVSGMEAMVGLLFFAFATGIVYGRFSKPSTFIKFSENAVIAPYKETGKAFMFRIVNAQPNTLIEMNARVILAIKTEDGENIYRRYFNLDLETANVVFFPMPWTIVHPITEESPLHGLTENDLKNNDAEFLIHIKGFDETYSQITNTIYSYTEDEIIWGAKFKRNFSLTQDGRVSYDINKIGETEPALILG